MSRITREGFIDSLGAQGGLDLTSLGDGAQAALQRAGIGPDALQGLAGADHVLKSRDELSALFDLIDRVDHNGHAGSIDTTKTTADGQTLPTLSGEVYDALRNKLEAARLGADKAAKSEPPKLPSPEAIKTSLSALDAAGFTDIHLRPTTALRQDNADWASHPYPKSPPERGASRVVGEAGCAPTSLANLDNGLRNARTTPDVTADFAVLHKVSGSPESTGTNTAGLARAWADQRGLGLTMGTSADQAKNADVLLAGLKANGCALVSVGVDPTSGRGHFTAGSHVVVVNACAMKDGQEWFSVVNPGRRDQSQPHRSLLTVDENVIQVPGAKDGVGRVWISRSQLELEMRRCYVFRPGSES